VNAGRCVRRSLDCINQPERIVCGCDGRLYRSPCEADGFHADGGCEPPEGTFRCGTTFCTHGTQYCQRWTYDTVSYASYFCGDLAAGCPATATCACVTTTECGTCTVSAEGDLTAMCHRGASDAGADGSSR
jgi:hypothetical protein